jgi:hypothetical protein
MKLSVEDIISKCVEGNAPQSIIRELTDELPDIKSICSSLEQDLRRSGVEVESIKTESSQVVVTVLKPSLETAHQVIETYSRIYPDVNVFLLP